jgi:mRNA-degrading endonuclease RelE of RelBE toxin-antitoxin system
MAYSVMLSESAGKALSRLSPDVRSPLTDILRDLENYPTNKKESRDVMGCDAHKIIHGNYRITFTVSAARLQIVVWLIRSRREAYSHFAEFMES